MALNIEGYEPYKDSDFDKQCHRYMRINVCTYFFLLAAFYCVSGNPELYEANGICDWDTDLDNVVNITLD